MNLDLLFSASYINWEGVAESCVKRTVSSRLLLFAARRYLSVSGVSGGGTTPLDLSTLHKAGVSGEIISAVSSPPESQGGASGEWGRFVDAAFAAELEMVQYGERPPLLAEVRKGLEAAASEAGERPELARWFEARRDALPGSDLPEDPGYLPV